MGVTAFQPSQTMLPAPAPSRPTEAATAHQPKDEQEHDCADERVQYERKDTRAEMNAEPRQQPVADESADQADDQIADQPKTAAGHDPAGEPAGDDADDENDQKALVGKVHCQLPAGICPLANSVIGEKFHAPARNFTDSCCRGCLRYLRLCIFGLTFAGEIAP